MEEAIKTAFQFFKEEHGEEIKLEDGDEFATVFDDGVLIISIEEKTLSMKALVGKPYIAKGSILD